MVSEPGSFSGEIIVDNISIPLDLKVLKDDTAPIIDSVYPEGEVEKVEFVVAEFHDDRDISSVHLVLDSIEVEPSLLTGNQLIYSTSKLASGVHILSLTLQDIDGNEARKDWTFSITDTEGAIAGDIDGDGVISTAELLEMLNGWDPISGIPVSTEDILTALSLWVPI